MLKEIGFVPKSFERKYRAVITDGGNLSDMKQFCNRFDSVVYHRTRQNYHNRFAQPFKEIKSFDVFYFKEAKYQEWFILAFSEYIIQWEWD
jgi:hypothetical protein